MALVRAMYTHRAVKIQILKRKLSQKLCVGSKTERQL